MSCSINILSRLLDNNTMTLHKLLVSFHETISISLLCLKIGVFIFWTLDQFSLQFNYCSFYVFWFYLDSISRMSMCFSLYLEVILVEVARLTFVLWSCIIFLIVFFGSKNFRWEILDDICFVSMIFALLSQIKYISNLLNSTDNTCRTCN